MTPTEGFNYEEIELEDSWSEEGAGAGFWDIGGGDANLHVYKSICQGI